MNNRLLKMRAISWVIVFIILHSSFIISEAQRSKEIYIQVIDTAGLTASVVADTSWILGQLDIVRAELADTSEAIQSVIDQQRRLYFAPYYLGQDTLGGIIYHLELDANGEVHGLIVCPLFPPTYAWTTKASDTTYAYSLSDGSVNMDSVKQHPPLTDYPAFYYADTLTHGGFTDWYIPAVEELRLLVNNYRFVYNKTDNLGVNNVLNRFRCWSSTETTLDEDDVYAIDYPAGIFLPSYDKNFVPIQTITIRKF